MNDIIAHCNMQNAPKQQRYLYDILRGRGDRGLNNPDALAIYGIGSLSRRVCDLMERGVSIRKEKSGRFTTYYFTKS